MNSSQYNLWIGTACLMLALAVLWSVLGGEMGNPTDIASPAFFPLLAGVLLTGVSLWLIVQALVVLKPFRAGFPRPWKAAGLVPAMALFMVYALAVPWVGMWCASVLAVPVLAWLFGQRRVMWLALLAVVPSWLVIRLFESALNVLFPQWGLPWSI